ncbi:MAG: hypothetical protein K6E10_10825 [Eubacterium sp.]|nr:hypothetical protein [Eubacterium sp.]
MKSDKLVKQYIKRGIAAFLAASLAISSGSGGGGLFGNLFGGNNVSKVYASSSGLDENTESASEEISTDTSTDTSQGIGTGTYDVEAGGEEARTEYHVTESGTRPGYKAFANMEQWKDRTIYDAPENTYSLTVSTGATDGSSVLFFGFKYKDTNGITRMQYLFPHLDAYDKSRDLLEYYANNENLKDTYGSKLLSGLNYKVDEVEEKTLGTYTVQDYAFITEAEIASVESIDVYIEQGSWTIQGLSLYKVDQYKGFEEYGLVSGQTFLDFSGTLISDVAKANANSQLTLPTKSAGGDTLVRIDNDTTKECYITNSITEEDSKKGFAVDSSLYTFRMDFSDVYEGGIEAFLNESAASVNSYDGIVEDVALELQYKDVHGWTRKVVLPVILSSYAMVKANVGDKSIMGFAQRGDTIAFNGLLPDFKQVMGKPILYVGSKARSAIKNWGVVPDTTTSGMTNNMSECETDDIKVAGISLYKGGVTPYVMDGTDSDGNTVAGATVQYAFENSSPISYQTTDQMNGRMIKGGGSESFKMADYKEGAPIIGAKKGQDQFLVTITTSEKSQTTASEDMSIQLFYETNDGQKTNTITYRARSAADEYMGYWPDNKGENFLQNSGLVPGGALSFLIEAKDFKNFYGAKVTVIGQRNWVMDNITISYVQTYDNRIAYVKEIESAGVKSNFWIERKAITAKFFNLKGIEYTVDDGSGSDEGTGASTGQGKVQKLDEDGNPMFDEDGNPVMIDYSEAEETSSTGEKVFKAGETYTINFGGETTVDIDNIDYSEVRYEMSWAQTQMDWGFFKAKKTYDIEVDVADDPDFDDGNGNSGSTNHFFFQLVFKNGNSAYVLANQQLSADGFRSGRQETFSISVNQDYGELTGVKIIPEEASDENDPFDKLNIAKITVSEETKGGSFISYIIDHVGWIDIDFRDELESASSQGQKARYEADISKVYKVSYKERNVKLLCEVAYEPWSGDYGQFIGSIRAVVTYIDTKGEQRNKVIDVVRGMADYLETSVDFVETYFDAKTGRDVVLPDGLGTYSDPTCMMRPNHTDRFIIPAISDLKTIQNITFSCMNAGEYVSQWNISRVTVSQVLSDGELRMNDNDEYVRDMTTKYICVSDNTQTLNNTLLKNTITTIPTINLTHNEIIWSSEEWATPVTRLPDTSDDSINIYVYPTSNSSNPSNAAMRANLRYNTLVSGYRAIEADNLRHATDGRGQDVYYIKGLSAQDFGSAGKLKLQCISENMFVDYAIVEHVRSDSVIGIYTYAFNGAMATMYPFASPTSVNSHNDNTEEVIAIQINEGTPLQNLVPEENDIAVGFTYTSTIDEGNIIYQSPYVYLTDVGYENLQEGLFAEIPFNVPFVKEITGYTIAGYGNISANIYAAAGQVYEVVTPEKIDKADDEASSKTLKKRSYASFNESYALSSRLTNHTVTSKDDFGPDSVTPVALTFETENASKDLDSSTKSAVKVNFKYIAHDGTEPTVTYNDITPYIQGDTKSFEIGQKQTVKIFLKEMNADRDLLSMYIVPYNLKVLENTEHVTLPDSENDSSTVQTVLDDVGNGSGVDLNDQSVADHTKEILEGRNAFWVVASLHVDLGFGERTIDRAELNQEFSGLNTNNTLRLTNIRQIIDITVNADPKSKTTIKTGEKYTMAAKVGDIINGNVFVVNSENGFEVNASRITSGASVSVASAITSKSTESFTFTVPQSDSPSADIENTIYQIEIYPVDAPDLVDIIEIVVEPTPKEEEESTEETTEATTEAPTEATTEATTQAPTQAPTEAPTEAPTQAPTEAPTQAPTQAPTEAVTDSGTTDKGTTDSGTTDSGTTDSGTTDSGTTDSGTTDSGTTDSGTTDSGTTDGGTTDSGTTDSGTTDSGSSDSGGN